MVAIQLRVSPEGMVVSRLGDTARFWALEVTCGFFLALRERDGEERRRTDRNGSGGVRVSDGANM